MKYIRPTPNPSGAYPPAQSNPAPGLVPISDELAAEVVAYNGFVALIIEDVAEGEPDNLIVIRKATAVAPNPESWEAWKASVPAENTESTPTAQDDTDAMLVDHEYRLTLLELGLTE